MKLDTIFWKLQAVVDELHDKADALEEKAKAIEERAAERGRDMTAKEQERYDALNELIYAIRDNCIENLYRAQDDIDEWCDNGY